YTTRQQYPHHQELWCIEAMRQVDDPAEEDGHQKSAALPEKIHDPCNGAGVFAANVHAGGETGDHGERQKEVGGYETKGHGQVVGVLRRNKYQDGYDAITAHGDDPAGKPKALS